KIQNNSFLLDMRERYKALTFISLCCYFVNALKISFPKTNTIKDAKMINPTNWAFSINLSLKGLPLIISMIRNNACPPSNAGIGSKFIKANAIESSPVMLQNLTQSQVPPYNFLAISTGPESALSALTSPLNNLPKPLALSTNEPHALDAPTGRDSMKP